jgi:AbrB family looped-hinge helix DNA binding protein
MTIKGQITLPMEIRRAMGLRAGNELDISLKGGNIVIQKPVSVESVRKLLRAEMREQGTDTVETISGSGWTADVEGRFAQS